MNIHTQCYDQSSPQPPPPSGWEKKISACAQPRWWHRSWMGYLVGLPLVVLALLGDLLWEYWLPQLSYFRTPLFLLVVVVVALFWGARPALFVVALSALLLDYFVLSPSGTGFYIGDGIVQLITFIVSGSVLAVLAAQREMARRRALVAEREAQAYAQALQQKNIELEQGNRLKDRFLSVVSHELKTPVTSISGYAQLLSRRLSKQAGLSPEQDTAQPLLEKIREQTGHITVLADELFDLTRIHSGNMRLRCAPRDFIEICRRVVEDQQQISGRPIELLAPSTPLLVNADDERLRRVVTNLISNALKYSAEDTPVEVRLGSEGEHVVLSVRDFGQGIPEYQQEHVFEAFYRSPSAQNSSRPGLGLGLAICKEIVEQHQGRLWLESEVGKGSLFVVELPKL
ncbi:MAG TPA: HAMP domain-containing sensor histidine kinase [Ktedonobacteraceae bacterium]|nr:HAMP domain-containing sensor histidine kinase [Ktedonobacteraceae bacterium]